MTERERVAGWLQKEIEENYATPILEGRMDEIPDTWYEGSADELLALLGDGERERVAWLVTNLHDGYRFFAWPEDPMWGDAWGGDDGMFSRRKVYLHPPSPKPSTSPVLPKMADNLADTPDPDTQEGP